MNQHNLAFTAAFTYSWGLHMQVRTLLYWALLANILYIAPQLARTVFPSDHGAAGRAGSMQPYFPHASGVLLTLLCFSVWLQVRLLVC